MSLETVIYLNNNKTNSSYYNSFVISLIGIVGLTKLNPTNNNLMNRLRQDKIVLQGVLSKHLDVYVIIQDLYNSKMITFNYAMKLIDLFQLYKYDGDIDHIIFRLVKVLKQLPPVITQKLSMDIKIVLDTIIENSDMIDDVVNRLYTFCLRKGINIDFVNIAKTVKRIL